MRSDSFTDRIHASMAFPYVFHLLLSGLIGIHCEIKTVSKVSVETGGSISIPCLYEQRYRDNVKYLCKGYLWFLCFVVRETSETEETSGKFFISDDKNQGVFTVTIYDLTNEHTYFFCAVAIENNPDDYQHFKLSVNSGLSSLYATEQKLTAFERGSVTVTCQSKGSKIAKWCRLGSTCVENPTGSIDGTPVKINTTIPDAFSVTMSDLRRESNGWYWCDNGNLQMPVLITVHESTSTTATSTTTATLRSNSTSFAGTIETSTVQPTNHTTKEAGGVSLKDEHKSAPKVMIVTITLVVQLLIVLGALFGWRRIKHNKAKRKVCNVAEDLQTFDSDVLYSTILHNRHNQFPTENVKRSIVIINDNVQAKTAAPEESVIYSTLKYNDP